MPATESVLIAFTWVINYSQCIYMGAVKCLQMSAIILIICMINNVCPFSFTCNTCTCNIQGGGGASFKLVMYFIVLLISFREALIFWPSFSKLYPHSFREFLESILVFVIKLLSRCAQVCSKSAAIDFLYLFFSFIRRWCLESYRILDLNKMPSLFLCTYWSLMRESVRRPM